MTAHPLGSSALTVTPAGGARVPVRVIVNANASGTLTAAVLVSSGPWIGRAGAADDDSWAGHFAERAALSRFIARHRIRRLLMLAGDANMVAIDDGSHSGYSGTGRAGFPVFHAAALDRVGSVTGGPYSEGAVPSVGHHGTMTVADHGDRVDVRLSGREHRDRELVGHAFAVDARAIR